MDNNTDFIIIDDDKLNNRICITLINKLFPNAPVADFIEAEVGLQHIIEKYSNPLTTTNGLLFLDIKMPGMDAWGFLEAFDKVDELVKKRIKIYILSSSIDKRDMDRANANPYVEYYLIKPLTRESISLIAAMASKKRAKEQKG